MTWEWRYVNVETSSKKFFKMFLNQNFLSLKFLVKCFNKSLLIRKINIKIEPRRSLYCNQFHYLWLNIILANASGLILMLSTWIIGLLQGLLACLITFGLIFADSFCCLNLPNRGDPAALLVFWFELLQYQMLISLLIFDSSYFKRKFKEN